MQCICHIKRWGPGVVCSGIDLLHITYHQRTPHLHLLFIHFCFNCQVFLGVVLFGMWHGLAFLPVILSLMGPQPYVTAHHDADGDEAEDRGRAGWDEKDRVDTGFFDPRSDPQFAYSHHSNPRHSPSPAQSSLHSAGYLQRSQMERERQRRSGRWPSHSSRHSDPRLQGYIPRATAFSSRRYSEGTTRQLMGHGALGTPRYYVKPMSYSKPAMYIKPSVSIALPWQN